MAWGGWKRVGFPGQGVIFIAMRWEGIWSWGDGVGGKLFRGNGLGFGVWMERGFVWGGVKWKQVGLVLF